MSGKDEVKNKKKVPAVTAYDKGPKGFFGSSKGFGKGPMVAFKRDFTGFKRGSR
jgi:hypothetical protein